MSNYVLSLSVPSGQEAAFERLTKAAILFLEPRGSVKASSLGEFSRKAAKGGVEHLALVVLECSDNAVSEPGLARSLEGVLRSCLSASNVAGGEVRVYTPSSS